MISGLPEKLKQLRLQHNFSQKDLAARLGVSPSIISGYETGERTPSVEILHSISLLYRCSADYLLGLERLTTIQVDGLTNEQITALQAFIDSMQNK